MAKFSSPLNHVSVAAPCSADWDQMIGDERTRFCGQCNLNVYNLSSMTRKDAERLIVQTEGRLCIRYYRRRDGSILTQNCPVGLRALKRRVAGIAKAVSTSVLSFLAGIGIYFAVQEMTAPRYTVGTMADFAPITVRENADQVTMPVVQGRAVHVIGKMRINPVPITATEPTATNRKDRSHTEATR